jgi:hypothetical protein
MQFPIWRYPTVLARRAKYFNLVLCAANMSACLSLGHSPSLAQYLDSVLGKDPTAK